MVSDVHGSAQSLKPAVAEPKLAEPEQAVVLALGGLRLKLALLKAIGRGPSRGFLVSCSFTSARTSASKTVQFWSLLYIQNFFLVSCVINHQMSTARERCPLNPSAHLTSASNAAQPVLSSHRESVAQAQRARAIAEAQNAPTDPTFRPTPPTLTIIPPDWSDNHSNPGSLLITPATSQTGSIPPSTAPPSESDQNAEQPELALKKGANKRKRQCRNSRRIKV